MASTCTYSYETNGRARYDHEHRPSGRLLRITEPVVTTWALMLVMTISAWVVSRRLALEPRPWQVAVEGTVETIQGAIAAVAPEQASVLLPFIATLWLFIGSANLLGVIPGLSAPTGHLSVTAALALLVFGSVHWFGIRAEGLRGHLGHYVTPTPLMLPFHILSELSRTVGFGRPPLRQYHEPGNGRVAGPDRRRLSRPSAAPGFAHHRSRVTSLYFWHACAHLYRRGTAVS